ncbi:restriction endonuclease subunit S [Lactobacillus delbrueckii]|uniref:restriction endonuclease subunit S n=1 Tax=Lactobacillus delbrueckii TaxID=1584 RepID=UPI001E52AB62|nr:restriction endonuclease subunit S [Lactobacillus delbrueckii]MCD5491345.1 restriction endonuclease subunit S [Lactobacillus delbrueckii subsp. lactis]
MLVKLKDVAYLVNDRRERRSDDVNHFVSTENLLSDRRGVSFPASTSPKSKYVHAYTKGDILISNIRPYFKKIWKATFDGTRSADVLCFRSSAKELSQDYLYVLLESESFFNYVTKTAKGTKMPRGDKSAILEFEFNLPSLKIQKEISHQIISIEKKIRLNEQINDNLSEINKTVFSNFFANQNSITKASDIADIRIGKTPPRKQKKWFSLNGGYKWLSIKDMKRDGIFALHTEEFLTKEAIEKYNIQVVPKHTVMLSFKLTIGRVKISEENMVTNEAIAQFRNSKLPYEYLYTYLGNFSFETLGSTSSIAQAINSRIIKSMPILIPERDLLNKYLNFARPIFSKMLILQKENIKLNRLKQVLLDKYF